MTATALAYDLAFEPVLDVFDDIGRPAGRPQLRLVQSAGGQGLPAPGATGALRAPQASATSPVAASAELYRRRRFTALAAFLGAVVLVLQLAGVSVASLTSSAAALPTSAEAAPLVHVVIPGDSYGAIATTLGASNPNAVAAQLRADNGGGELVVGQRIVVAPSTLQLDASS